MSLPEVKLSHRWVSEHEQEMERVNPWPPGRPLHGFEKKPITGPLLLVGYYFELDGVKYGASMAIDPFRGHAVSTSLTRRKA